MWRYTLDPWEAPTCTAEGCHELETSNHVALVYISRWEWIRWRWSSWEQGDGRNVWIQEDEKEVIVDLGRISLLI